MARRATARGQAIVADAAETRFREIIVFGMTAILVLVIASFASIAFAAGSDSGSGGVDNYKSYGVSAEMRQATVLVKKEAFADALPFLQKEVTNNPDNADAWNLIGFSSRKRGYYVTAEAAYDKALAINPKHKGALEYKGELYLTLGNLAGAEELLARLSKTCSFNCSEVRDLKEAIAAYKKAQ